MRNLRLVCLSIFSFFFVHAPVAAQSYFSKSIDVGESSNTIGFMKEQDGLVLMLGRHFCPQPGFIGCSGLIVYDYQEGIVMDTMYSRYPATLSGIAEQALDFVSFYESIYAFHIYDFIHPGAWSNLRVFKIDNFTGELLDSFDFDFCPADMCQPGSIKTIPSGGYYIYGQARDTTHGWSGFFLARLEDNLRLKWIESYPLIANMGTQNTEMLLLPNEDVILAANLHSGPRKYASLVYVNSEGEEVWRDSYIEEDSYRGEGNARITALLDGEHFMLSWVMDTLNTDVIDRDSPKFIKYNLSGDIVNSYKIPAPFLAPVDVFSITTAMNGDIIATGRARVSQSPGHGVLFRFSPEGELRWMKFYYDGGHGVFDDPNQLFPNMHFYDAVELPDGSILAGGSRVDTVGLGFANVNAWLVRVDAEGNCLDPEACGQLEITKVVITSSTDPVAEVEDMVLYPNPARDRVYISQLPDQEGALWLFDADGRVLKEIPGVRSNAEFDLSDLPVGLYFVEYRSGDGRKIIQGRVVKQ